jgi:N-acetyl-anhydromuramyl-L-alanine amidase AmpD
VPGTLLVGGKEIPVTCKVVRDDAFTFRALPRRKRTTATVLHWTGGAGLGEQVYRTLRTRGLSVHLCIDPDGTVHQYCDLDRLCSHAGRVDDENLDGRQHSANVSTVGIEIVNPANRETLMRGVKRELVREKIHGVDVTYSAFTQAQTDAAIEVTRAICRHYGLPATPPMDGDDVLSSVMGEREWLEFRGVVGHLNLTERKRDPGLALMREFVACGNGAAR